MCVLCMCLREFKCDVGMEGFCERLWGRTYL
jgi:hypothetical protein